MTVEELHLLLTRKGNAAVVFQLPSGERIPEHFHVTEVGRVDKRFIDCGGTRRQTISCLLQLWTAHDVEHQLTADKLARILSLAQPVLDSPHLPVEVEYGADVAAQYAISDFDVANDKLVFILSGKRTDCLAPDRCGVAGCDSQAGCC